MRTYIVEPQMPLVFRGGKPFGAATREAAHFPWPSSSAGALRTAFMRQTGCEPQQTLNHRVHGPLLLRAAEHSSAWEPMVPAPADAVLLGDERGGKLLVRLRPGRFPHGTGADMPAGLRPVVLPEDAPAGKAQALAPFWPLSVLQQWDDGQMPDAARVATAGASLQTEARTHVVIDRDSGAAAEGLLFQTQALDFGPAGLRGPRFALAVRSQLDLQPQMLTLGGERRFAWLQGAAQDPFAPPAPWMQGLREAKCLALSLLTPAPLLRGFLPGWIDAHNTGEHPEVPGLRLRLVAMANKRWEAVSGWDLQQWQPRPMRKAVPAGSTFWFEVLECPQDDAWPQRLWLASMCDAETDRRDGWGLALPRPVNDWT